MAKTKKELGLDSMGVQKSMRLTDYLGDGLGQLPLNIMSCLVGQLTYFYTEKVGLAAGMVATMLLIAKIFDAFSDLAMGKIMDNGKSPKGKCRPWFARMAIPAFVSIVLLFTVPKNMGSGLQAAYVLITNVLITAIVYTAVAIPYSALMAIRTESSEERGKMGIFRAAFGYIAGMVIAILLIPITNMLGGTQSAWIKVAVVFSLISLLSLLILYKTSKENVQIAEKSEDENVPFVEGIKILFKNKYWLLMVVSLFAMYFMMSCFFGSAVYFTMYNMGNDGYYAMVSNLLSIAQIATLFITPFLMKKISKRNLFMGGMAVATVGFVLSGLTTSYSLICLSSVIKGIGFGCGGASMFGCLQDAITYGEWYNGYGTAGMGNAASSFCMKVGSGIGTAALGWILAAGGFDAQLKVQSASALSSIAVAFAWVPVITSVICVICMAFFDVDKYYGKVVEDLSQGKHRGE